MNKRILVILVLLILTIGCSQQSKEDTTKVTQVFQNYFQALGTGEPQKVKGYLTTQKEQAEFREVVSHVGSDLSLRELVIKDINIANDTATIKYTLDNHEHLSILIMENNQWLVNLEYESLYQYLKVLDEQEHQPDQ